ncbi:DNA polymerase III subunit gamma/tau [Peptoniphilus obesi]|uniref:DNA polymerase III subunit gamma/tau n=1 Tax=Peptoniphilus obesi TaxID=1472765 RepID=UPI0004AD3EFB|nr:DNA polymerase III subunit gamma/tau [Peptoniphilus obesi]
MYRALYRKYRPEKFEDLLGQDNITRALRNQIKKNEISHAYVFSGTRGTGKTSAAKIFSKAVNCLNPIDGEPCNECENCKAISSDRSLDVVEMDAASNNGVDDIRDIKEKVVYPPQNLKYKVYIIDEVHMLSKGAFNALLKVLEEPPSHLIFILATTEIEKIPATILSRTQKYNFVRISKEKIVENLEKICKNENRSCDKKVFELIANNSDGSMRDSLSILDQLLSIDQDYISYDIAIDVLGISSEKLIYDLIKTLIDKDLRAAIDQLDLVYKDGKDILILVDELIKRLRDILVIKLIEDPKELLYTTDLDSYRKLAEIMDNTTLLEIINILNKMLADMKYAQDKRTILEMNIIKIVELSSNSLEARIKKLEDYIADPKNNNLKNLGQIENKEVKEKKDLKENKRQVENINTIDEKTIKPEKEEKIEKEDKLEKKEEEKNSQDLDSKDEDDLSIENIKSDWNNILIELRKRGRMNIPILLSSGKAVDYKNKTLIIEYDRADAFNYEAISNQENTKFVEDFLNNYYNRDISVRFILDKDEKKQEAIRNLEKIIGKENLNRI